MKIRRILATAVATAVTTPVLLLSVTPAFADGKPAAQTQEKPSIAELEKAAAAAKAVYDSAVEAEDAAEAALEALSSDSAPLVVAVNAAKAAAVTADAEKGTADQALVAAKAALADLPADATEEERAAKAAAVTEAETAASAAAVAKEDADAKVLEAQDTLDDARVAAARAIGQAQEATKEALAQKEAADEALAKAIEEGEGDEECVPEAKLKTVVTGLPSTVVAGTKVDFRLRVTNGTTRTMDEVYPFAYVHATDKSGVKDLGDLVHLQWSPGSSGSWKNVDNEHYMDAISPLKAGAHEDIKMRLAVDAKAPAGNGVTFVAGDYWNDNGTCGGSPDLEGYEFLIAAKGSTPATGDATPTTKPADSGVKPQSGGSATPVGGSLAATGSSSATSQLALASGAALAIGAGAVYVARRRKAGAHA
ncbi:peptidase [Streptomyces sp. NBC_00178]|uniref:LAETG motif-containing sortase-dependent surface protein n=1 Tax=Streptomyces sp. NBC_00178 TaxID=2975672 RepID=UPI002E2E5EDE|nr:LAETG motif-containing sortase-dependent surface protein [Streptomyces sp. NBC_00178]